MSIRDTDERPESDIRKRAAWLLAMLAVVAGLFVLLSVTLFTTSGGGGTDHGGIAAAPTGPTPTAVPPTAPSTAPSTSAGSSGAGSSSASGSPAASSSTAGSSAPVGAPSCPGASACTVTGDVAGAGAAINALRAGSGEPPVTVTAGPTAQKCALSSGNDCPSSFVWVRVADLSGASVVTGVQGFHSGKDLLDKGAKAYQLGWAYDPGSRLLSCAVIRNP